MLTTNSTNMKALKRTLGIIWMLLAPAAVIVMFWQAFEKIGMEPEGIARTNTALQWGIILFIFIPIAIGLFIFGYYSVRGEFDELPTNSDEL